VVIHTVLTKPTSGSRLSVVLLEPFPGPDVPFDCIQSQLRLGKPDESSLSSGEWDVMGKPARAVNTVSDGEAEHLLALKVPKGELLVIAKYPLREEQSIQKILKRVAQSLSFDE